MGKSKKATSENEMDESMDASLAADVEAPRLSYEEQLQNVSVIATPMAPKKLAKRLYKLIKKASEQKTFLRHGLKDVQASIRKGETGICVFAGDVTPIEVMCHMPAVCEEKNIPYVYTPSRNDLGAAMGVKRSCLMVLIREHPDFKDLYDECISRIQPLTISMLM
ncbi:H/ACA ribonucleoprotein complex subunit 2-like protein [Uloborus diversus]|uniref:H/ACA ribonucleoprotein complex subunit 2-like protein n=1 Tax=Uloborus diversus TaxID=327109 RepID=UPI00240A0361|nr:H/ACA ribonucleoprotein complex subunit 2-like protein [Uloborus diversus]